jgi:YHS domain-containing protein
MPVMALLAFLFRLIVVLVILRLGGIVLRAFLGGLMQGSRPEGPSNPAAGWGPGPPVRGQVEELVRDPVCGVHTARSSAIAGRYQGAPAYFCSPECAEKARAESA